MSDPTKDLVSPWHPMTEPGDLKALGKLVEELGECLSAAARCMIQGIDESEPTTGKVNRVWLEEEMADVYANMQIVEERFQLNGRTMRQRAYQKYHNLKRWHAGA